MRFFVSNALPRMMCKHGMNDRITRVCAAVQASKETLEESNTGE